MSGSGWQPVLPGIEVFSDSCNVYAVAGPEGTVFVNAGTGHWLDGVPARFRPPYTLLCTHYFRDHSAGAARASRMGFDIRVPTGEAGIFADPVQHFRERQSYIVYDNIWDQVRADRTGAGHAGPRLRYARRRGAWSSRSSPSPASPRTTPAMRWRQPTAP